MPKSWLNFDDPIRPETRHVSNYHPRSSWPSTAHSPAVSARSSSRMSPKAVATPQRPRDTVPERSQRSAGYASRGTRFAELGHHPMMSPSRRWNDAFIRSGSEAPWVTARQSARRFGFPQKAGASIPKKGTQFGRFFRPSRSRKLLIPGPIGQSGVAGRALRHASIPARDQTSAVDVGTDSDCRGATPERRRLCLRARWLRGYFVHGIGLRSRTNGPLRFRLRVDFPFYICRSGFRGRSCLCSRFATQTKLLCQGRSAF